MNWFEWLPAASAGAASLGVVGAAVRYMGSVRDKRRERAAVVAWHGLKNGKPVLGVRNYSDQPLLDVVVEIYAEGGVANWRIGLLHAGEEQSRSTADIGATASEAADSLAVWCTDSTGRAWFRTAQGKLYRAHWWGRRRYALVERVSALRARRRLARLPRGPVQELEETPPTEPAGT